MTDSGFAHAIAAQRAPRSEHIELLRKRAAALATDTADRKTHGDTVAITFTLSGERYALDARVVREVVPLRNLTPLPTAAAPLFGVSHWRGIALTILDIRETLGLRTGGVTDLGRVLVIDSGSMPFGIIVDAVNDLATVARGELQALPDATGNELRAVAGVHGDGTLVLDEDFLLAWASLGDQTNRQSGG